MQSANGRSGGAAASSASLFTSLWNALADLLGTAATATLLRRSARRAMARAPELVELTIVRQSLEYRYTLPAIWSDSTEATSGGLRLLVAELVPLLVELTGSVVVRHLARMPEFRDRAIIPPQEDKP